MFDLFTAGPQMGMRALDDLHSLAMSLRRLAAEDGDLRLLTVTAAELPVVEDQLSASVAALRDDVELLRNTVNPLHREATDLDHTAESLQAALAALRGQVDTLSETVQGLRADLASLRDRIPGL